jgi:hypothetical protein
MPRVVVHLRRRDLLRAQFQVIRRMRIFKFLFLAFLAFGVWDWYRYPPIPEMPWYLWTGEVLLAASLITGAAILLVFLIVAPLMLLRLRKTRGVVGEHSFEITPEGLREVTDVSEIRVAWGSARKVFRTRSFLFALIHDRGAFLFPRHAFSDSAAYDEFWKGLQPLAAKKVS